MLKLLAIFVAVYVASVGVVTAYTMVEHRHACAAVGWYGWFDCKEEGVPFSWDLVLASAEWPVRLIFGSQD